MNTRTNPTRQQKIKELKPKRQPKQQEQTQFEKDLIELMKLRQQNQVMNQINKSKDQIIRDKRVLITIGKDVLKYQQKKIAKFTLLQVLEQKPQVQVPVHRYVPVLTQIRYGMQSMQELMEQAEDTRLTDQVERRYHQHIMRNFEITGGNSSSNQRQRQIEREQRGQNQILMRNGEENRHPQH